MKTGSDVSQDYFEVQQLEKGQVSPGEGFLLHRDDFELFALSLDDAELAAKLLESPQCKNAPSYHVSYQTLLTSIVGSLAIGLVAGALVF